MSAIDIIKHRLKEERIPDAPWPEDAGEKKKRPREVAFMDVNLCFAPSVIVTFSQTIFPGVFEALCLLIRTFSGGHFRSVRDHAVTTAGGAAPPPEPRDDTRACAPRYR